MIPNRRQFLGAALATTALAKSSLSAKPARPAQAPPRSPESRRLVTALYPENRDDEIRLTEFEPRCMLVVPEHPVRRARYPVIDMHTHITGVFRRTPGADDPLQGTPKQRLDLIIKWMDEMNLQTLVNLTGGSEEGLQTTMNNLVNPYKGRFVTCTTPDYSNFKDPGWPEWQAEQLGKARKMGAIGFKVSKTLGLYLREGGYSRNERERDQQGPLVKIDDERLFPSWKAAGELNLPVFIHISDPDAFFTPYDRFNERWQELYRHPERKFYGSDFPTKPELHAARNRVIKRFPGTKFVALHVSTHPENLDDVSAFLENHPNSSVELGASLGALGRQPRRSRKFFEDYQDRIMFGTDASPNNYGDPQQILVPEMYHAYFRYLQTLDEHFDYSPGRIPPQGIWRIYGIGLPDEILRKVYHNNAARLLGMDLV